MRSLVHLSDLFIGRTDAALLDALVQPVRRVSPDLVVVSGNLTQRARSWQLQEAKAFLNRLPRPQVVVPGHRDIPLYDLGARFMRPLSRYSRYVTNDLAPWFVDDEIAVLGINTARSPTLGYERNDEALVDRLERRFRSLPATTTKVVVTHHPFDPPAGYDSDELVEHTMLATRMLSICDLLLTGHLPRLLTEESSMRCVAALPHEAVIVHGGCASMPDDGPESLSFNVIEIDSGRLDISRYSTRPGVRRFEITETERFERTALGWRQRPEQAVAHS